MVSRVELLEDALEWALPWVQRFAAADLEAAVAAADQATPPGRRVTVVLHVDRSVAAAIALATTWAAARLDDVSP